MKIQHHNRKPRQKVFTKRRLLQRILPGVLAIIVILFCVYRGYNPLAVITTLVDRQTPATLFIFLMIVLPVFGFPISIFLVLSGLKFGFLYGTLITVITMPLHLAASFLLANSMLRPQLEAFCRRKNYRVPRIPQERMLGYSLVFLVLPGLSYTMKNYLLSLSGIPFRYYLGLGWSVQGVMGIPLILFGEQPPQMKLYLGAAFVLLFLLSVGIAYRLKKGRPAG